MKEWISTIEGCGAEVGFAGAASFCPEPVEHFAGSRSRKNEAALASLPERDVKFSKIIKREKLALHG